MKYWWQDFAEGVANSQPVEQVQAATKGLLKWLANRNLVEQVVLFFAAIVVLVCAYYFFFVDWYSPDNPLGPFYRGD